LRDFRDPEADAAEGVKGGALPQMLPQQKSALIKI
jgi:hypothetical protein